MASSGRQNFCFFRKICAPGGEEIDAGYLTGAVYIERLDLSGPQLLLTYRDIDHKISGLGIKEYDEMPVSMSDDWEGSGTEINGNFTVLKVSRADDTVNISLMESRTYELKKMATQTRVFHNRAVPEILRAVAHGLTPGLCSCGVVNDYHIVAGERPSATLRQLAKEQGAHVWAARGTITMERMAVLAAKPAAIVFQYGKDEENKIYDGYRRLSDQLASQDTNFRTFTGWDEEKGRVKTSPGIPFFAGLSGRRMAPSPTSAQTGYTLNAAPLSTQRVVAFTTDGNLKIRPGIVIAMKWNTGNPENPIDETLPSSAVVDVVAHSYMFGRFYSRVECARAAVAI